MTARISPEEFAALMAISDADARMDGADVRAIRKGMKLSQRRFAEELGVSVDYVSDMELGKIMVNRRTALAIRFISKTGAMAPRALRVSPA